MLRAAQGKCADGGLHVNKDAERAAVDNTDLLRLGMTHGSLRHWAPPRCPPRVPTLALLTSPLPSGTSRLPTCSTATCSWAWPWRWAVAGLVGEVGCRMRSGPTARRRSSAPLTSRSSTCRTARSAFVSCQQLAGDRTDRAVQLLQDCKIRGGLKGWCQRGAKSHVAASRQQLPLR